MPDIGTAGWIAVAAIVGALVVLAVLHFGFHVFRRRRVRRPPRHAEIASLGRVEVLESTPIDAERRLVLVRCDGIEHLIMIGGPADLIVENDVKKVRGPASSSARTPIPEPETRKVRPPPPPVPTASAPTPAASKPAAPKPIPAKPAETNRSAAARASTDTRPTTSPPRSGLAAVTPASARTGSRASDHSAATGKAEEPAWTRTPAPRPAQTDSQFGRRDATPRRTAAQASPLPAVRSSEPARPQSGTLGAGRINRSNIRAAEETVGLPAAQIPWTDPDSIENEIVRALKFDPQIRGSEAGANRREPMPTKPIVDSSTTLGDLADRLEEALAREVQSARSIDIDLEEFSFDNEEMAKLGPPPQPQKERSEKRERSEPRIGATPAQEPEPRRETPSAGERREEAPVISLSSRRRDNADPLEDEMARLLGELTSDTKSR